MTAKFLNLISIAKSVAVIGLIMSQPANALTVYQTVGDYGEVKYSQFPPKGKEYTPVELRGGVQPTPLQQPSSTNNSNTALPQNTNGPINETLDTQQQVQNQQPQNNHTQRCQSLRNNLNNLNSGGSVYVTEENGGRRYLDNREIELKRENVQKLINQYCLD